MNLLVIGVGPVGRTLAGRWSAAGHTVSVAVRDPAAPKHDPYRDRFRLVPAGVLPTADVTVLAVPGDQLGDLLDATATRLDGRVLIDATNTPGRPRLHQQSLLAERLAAADVHRAFTSIGWENFSARVAGERPDMLWTGSDGPARPLVERLIADVGPRPVRLGDPVEAADALDAVARLWFALALGRGLGRRLAVRILTGPAEAAGGVPTATPRRVTIVGRGRVGSALGAAFIRAGHTVTYASRAAAGGTVDGGGIADVATALRTGDTVVLAVPGPAVAGLVEEHRDALAGRLVVDATNLVGDGPTDSAAVVATAPRARYARAFNSLGVENLTSPRIGGVPADMVFTAAPGDRAVVADLVRAVGLRPVWLPPGDEPVIDGLLRLWFRLARTHGRHVAVRVLTDHPGL